MQNALKSNEWWWIWVHKTFKIEIQNGGPNISDFLQNWFPPEIRPPLFNLYKFQDYAKSTLESSRMHWNLMNEGEIVSIKLLKLKYRSGKKIIDTFCLIASNKKLGPSSLICRNFKILRKVLLNHAECIEMW